MYSNIGEINIIPSANISASGIASLSLANAGNSNMCQNILKIASSSYTNNSFNNYISTNGSKSFFNATDNKKITINSETEYINDEMAVNDLDFFLVTSNRNAEESVTHPLTTPLSIEGTVDLLDHNNKVKVNIICT